MIYTLTQPCRQAYNFQSDLSSEDEVLTNFSSLSIDSADEKVIAERKWQCGTFIPLIPEFNGKAGLQDTVLLLGNTPLDYFQLFFDDNIMQRIVKETNRYYSQNPVGDRQHMSNW